MVSSISCICLLHRAPLPHLSPPTLIVCSILVRITLYLSYIVTLPGILQIVCRWVPSCYLPNLPVRRADQLIYHKIYLSSFDTWPMMQTLKHLHCGFCIFEQSCGPIAPQQGGKPWQSEWCGWDCPVRHICWKHSFPLQLVLHRAYVPMSGICWQIQKSHNNTCTNIFTLPHGKVKFRNQLNYSHYYVLHTPCLTKKRISRSDLYALPKRETIMNRPSPYQNQPGPCGPYASDHPFPFSVHPTSCHAYQTIYNNNK